MCYVKGVYGIFCIWSSGIGNHNKIPAKIAQKHNRYLSKTINRIDGFIRIFPGSQLHEAAAHIGRSFPRRTMFFAIIAGSRNPG